MEKIKAILLLLIAMAITSSSTVLVPRMWVNVGLLEVVVIVFFFYAVWNVKETFEL